MDKSELMRIALMTGVVVFEWYMMQPYHEPVLARAWHILARIYQGIAAAFGRAALHAEHNYYVAAEAGL